MSGIIFINSLKDAAADLVSVVAFLFITFLIIELVEFYFFNKVSAFVKNSGKYAPLIGALAASFPQCGFSIIASVLYVRGLITKGTLLAVYLSTSDEALPVLLSMPEHYKTVFPLVAIKIFIGVVSGYCVDFIFKERPKIIDNVMQTNKEGENNEIDEKGCCKHDLESRDKKELIIHPLVHTISIGAFIFLITFILNVLIANCGSAEALGAHLMSNSPLQSVMAAFFGLIPNCAVSVALIMLYTKGSIAFSSVISGLCANSGLGIWVVFTKNKSLKDSFLILSLLFLISVFFGVLLYFTPLY